MNNANYRKHNDHTQNSSTYHKKDGTPIRTILKRETKEEIREHFEPTSSLQNSRKGPNKEKKVAKKIKNKIRKEVVIECKKAMIACWNHYADVSIDVDYCGEYEITIDTMLPTQLTTNDWRKAHQEDKDQKDHMIKTFNEALNSML